MCKLVIEPILWCTFPQETDILFWQLLDWDILGFIHGTHGGDYTAWTQEPNLVPTHTWWMSNRLNWKGLFLLDIRLHAGKHRWGTACCVLLIWRCVFTITQIEIFTQQISLKWFLLIYTVCVCVCVGMCVCVHVWLTKILILLAK